MSNLPQRINVSKTVTYDVPRIISDLEDMGHQGDIEMSDILDYIKDWVEEDFETGIDLIYQDENGEEL